jgi:hypothetical protein
MVHKIPDVIVFRIFTINILFFSLIKICMFLFEFETYNALENKVIFENFKSNSLVDRDLYGHYRNDGGVDMGINFDCIHRFWLFVSSEMFQNGVPNWISAKWITIYIVYVYLPSCNMEVHETMSTTIYLTSVYHQTSSLCLCTFLVHPYSKQRAIYNVNKENE